MRSAKKSLIKATEKREVSVLRWVLGITTAILFAATASADDSYIVGMTAGLTGPTASTFAPVAEAMRKYQNATAAQELVSAAAESGADRDRLEQYVVNLAAEREKEYQVMDQEAQRCRAQVLASPAKKKK